MPGPRLTQVEARSQAALHALEAILRAPAPPHPDIADELRKIELWLRRESYGHDKILMRQVERETGRQVRMPRGGPKR